MRGTIFKKIAILYLLFVEEKNEAFWAAMAWLKIHRLNGYEEVFIQTDGFLFFIYINH
jgi:hypothetical protein